jgi:hypothetical protein
MLDLRLPIGIYFLINAVILIGSGIVQPSISQVGTQTVNLNLCWGVVMGVFGAFMLSLALLDKKKSKPE